MLSFDQVGFYLGLNLLTGAPLSVLFGGWVAKMGAVAIYSVLVGCYLRWVERPSGRRAKTTSVSDVFDMLTYRERYEDLLRAPAAMRSPACSIAAGWRSQGRRPSRGGVGGPAREPSADRHRSLQEIQ